MSSIIVGETYDLLLKMVVIGGYFDPIQTLELEKPIFYLDFKETSSVFNQSLLLESNLLLKLFHFKLIKSKFKFGTQLVNKNSEV